LTDEYKLNIIYAGEAKFDIKTGNLTAVYGFTGRTVKRLSKVVLENSELMMEAWKDYEGQE
jgi:hypothetical protein